MKIKKACRIIIPVATAVAAIMMAAAGSRTVMADSGEYYLPDSEFAINDNTYKVYKYTLSYEFVADGDRSTSIQTRGIIVNRADALWFEEPVADCCEYCGQKLDGTYSARVSMKGSDGSYFENDGLKLYGLGQASYDRSVVGLEITQTPKDTCPYCNRRIGSTLRVGALYVGIPYISFISQPSSVSVSAGDKAEFDFDADYDGEYRWGIVINGQWNEISDGGGPYGETYSGSNTSHLTVSNVNGNLDGKEYKCQLTGVFRKPVYTDGATITVVTPDAGGGDPDSRPTGPTSAPQPTKVPLQPTKVPVQPTKVPSQPTKVPSQPTTAPSQPTTTPSQPKPDDPVPTAVPATPTPKPTGAPKDTSEYRPKSSSSTVKPPKPDDPKSSSSTSSSSTSSTTKKEDIKPVIDDIVIPPRDDDDKPYHPRTSSSEKGSTKKDGRTSTSAKGGSTGKGSTTSTSRIPGSSTIIKDGILYIIDDDDISADEGDDSKKRIDETVDAERAYSAADLAVEGSLSEQSASSMFWRSVPGYITIIGIILLLLLLALFFLFFGVIVTGEVEEHDEVFELCAIRLMRRNEDGWCVNLGSAFDDNAVLKLHIGVLFAVIFEDWELTGEVTGLYEGKVTGQIAQNMLMYRRKCVRFSKKT